MFGKSRGSSSHCTLKLWPHTESQKCTHNPTHPHPLPHIQGHWCSTSSAALLLGECPWKKWSVTISAHVCCIVRKPAWSLYSKKNIVQVIQLKTVAHVSPVIWFAIFLTVCSVSLCFSVYLLCVNGTGPSWLRSWQDTGKGFYGNEAETMDSISAASLSFQSGKVF